MPQFDKYGKEIKPTSYMGAPSSQGQAAMKGLQSAGGAQSTGGFGGTGRPAGNSYGIGSVQGMGPLPPSGNNYNSSALANSGVATGGEGSSYTGDPNSFEAKYTVTPNLLPQKAKIAQEQTQLEGDIAAKAAGMGNQYTQSQMGLAGDIASKAANQNQGFTETNMGLGNKYTQEQATQKEGLGEKAFKSQFDLLLPYFDKWTSTGPNGGGPMQPHVEMDPGGAEAAGQSAAFARAKDQAGSIGRSALNSLNDVMGARGITGSGIGVNQAGGVVQEGARQLGDVTREQLIQSLALARQRASEQYQGNITQRGQDVTQQGNNVNKNLTIQQSLLGILGRGITY